MNILDKGAYDNEFYNWLREHFSNFKEAKEFAHKWYEEMEQQTPFGEFTMRAMAGHISLVLEGKGMEDDKDYTTYMNTEYGPSIYLAM